MKDIDIDYWLKDIRYGQIRGHVILYLLDLMDRDYQMCEWIKEGKDRYFDANISFAGDMFFEDLDLNKNVEAKQPPINKIGKYLKDSQEAECLLKICNILWYMWCNFSSDQDYLSSAELPKLRELSKQGFSVFMENEKDNKEFCEFVLGVIEKEHTFKSASKKTAYENITSFIDSVTEF